MQGALLYWVGSDGQMRTRHVPFRVWDREAAELSQPTKRRVHRPKRIFASTAQMERASRVRRAPILTPEFYAEAPPVEPEKKPQIWRPKTIKLAPQLPPPAPKPKPAKKQKRPQWMRDRVVEQRLYEEQITRDRLLRDAIEAADIGPCPHPLLRGEHPNDMCPQCFKVFWPRFLAEKQARGLSLSADRWAYPRSI